MSTNSKTTISPPTDTERIESLEKRVGILESQLLVCMRWMRREAEKEAVLKDPDFKPMVVGLS